MAARRSSAGPSEDQGSIEEPMIIGVFTHKGGTGKTTLSVMLGAMLAKKGHKTILVDGDPQQSLTTFYAEDKLEELEEPSVDAEEEWSEDEEEGAVLTQGGKLALPLLPGDRLRKADAMPADVMHGIKRWCEGKDDLFEVLKKTVRNEDFVARPTPVNTDDYGNRLLLLPGSPQLSKFSHDLERNADTTLAGEFFGAFGKAMRDMAKSVGAQFVIVDLGPHTDTLHKVIITSCHAIQPVVNACHYSVFSTFNMLYEVLPSWIKWFKDFAPEHGQAECGKYAYNQRFPRVLPFLGFRYDVKGAHVQWSDSNLFETMRQTIAGESIGEDTQPLPAEVKALYVPLQGSRSKPPTMLVPFIRHLHFLPVAQETGRAFFDLSDKNLRDYYQNSVHDVELGKLKKEMEYVEQRFAKLGRNMDLLRRAFAQERQAEREAASQKAAKKGSAAKGKKRQREREATPGTGASPSTAGRGERAKQARQAAGEAGQHAAQPAGASRRKPAAPQRVSPGLAG